MKSAHSFRGPTKARKQSKTNYGGNLQNDQVKIEKAAAKRERRRERNLRYVQL